MFKMYPRLYTFLLFNISALINTTPTHHRQHSQTLDESIDWDALQPIEELPVFHNSPVQTDQSNQEHTHDAKQHSSKYKSRTHENARQPEYRSSYQKQRRATLIKLDPEGFKRKNDRRNEKRRENRKNMTQEEKERYLARRKELNRLSDARLRIKNPDYRKHFNRGNIKKRIADGTATESDIKRLEHMQKMDKYFCEEKRKARREAKSNKKAKVKPKG